MKLISLFVRPDITVINDPDERQRRIQDELDDVTGRNSESLFDGCYEGVGRPKIYTGLDAQMRRDSLRDQPRRTHFWHGNNYPSGGGVPA